MSDTVSTCSASAGARAARPGVGAAGQGGRRPPPLAPHRAWGPGSVHVTHRIVAAVDVVAHKQVVRLRGGAPDPEQLHQVVELAVDVAADGHGALDGLHIRLIDQQFPCLRVTGRRPRVTGQLGGRGPSGAVRAVRTLSQSDFTSSSVKGSHFINFSIHLSRLAVVATSAAILQISDLFNEHNPSRVENSTFPCPMAGPTSRLVEGTTTSVRLYARGQRFVNGMSNEYDARYPAELDGVISEDEFLRAMSRINNTMRDYWPCCTCFYFGWCCAPCTLGLSFLGPRLCVGDVRRLRAAPAPTRPRAGSPLVRPAISLMV